MKESYKLNRFQPDSSQREPTGSPPDGTSRISLIERVSTRIISWFNIPEGYQDENGFHYGPQPKPAWMTASAATTARHLFTDRASDAISYASAAAPQVRSTPCRVALPDSIATLNQD